MPELVGPVGVDPSRLLSRLVELRLVEQLVPVTEHPDKTRREWDAHLECADARRERPEVTRAYMARHTATHIVPHTTGSM